MDISMSSNFVSSTIEDQPDVGQVWSSKLTSGFTSTILVILASELGDKTFVLTTLMAMKHNRQSVFLGNLTAALLMIGLTIVLALATSIIPKSITHYLAVILFIIFGSQMIVEGLSSSDSAELDSPLKSNPTEGNSKSERLILKIKSHSSRYFSLIFVESFALRFFAEWGDRSQIALVLLAAREDVVGIMVGAVVGHVICLSLAVIGGGIIAKVLSPRSVSIIGGWIFLCVALHAIVKGPDN